MDGALDACIVSGSKIARDGDARSERQALDKADEQENQRPGGAHGGQRPVSEEPPDDERVRGIVELLENLTQKNRQREASNQPPRAALRHIQRCAFQGVSASFYQKNFKKPN